VSHERRERIIVASPDPDPKDALVTEYSIKVVRHSWERFDEVLALSYAELYEPWGVPRDADWYHPAHGSEFAVALASGDAEQAGAAGESGCDTVAAGALLGTARLLPAPGDTERQVRQVVVAPHARGLGLGRELMGALEMIARGEDAAELWLNARLDAVGFYDRLGWASEGDEFVSTLTGIPHVLMRKRLR
jgi:GNAT superfamily N-acetyltransferase